MSYLIARVLALRRRHLAPPLRVPLEALTLIWAHGLIALETLPELLLLLLGEALEALVRGVDLALTLRGQGLEAPEVFLHSSPVGGSHPAKPLIVLARHLTLLRREALPLAIVLERALALLGRHLLPFLEIPLRLRALLRRQPIESANSRLARLRGGSC